MRYVLLAGWFRIDRYVDRRVKNIRRVQILGTEDNLVYARVNVV